ncbi:MAG TPA: class I SAM-dependent methyltransferase [Perlabentimonas sp.]|nr:class I SAM-dependent methyltransferase [Perlabentimonas sp.]
MSFYQQIAPYYHHIFKLNPNQVNFIKIKIPETNCSILDVGCGVGTLSFELGSYYRHVLGVDMDAEMIHIALRTQKGEPNSVHFQQVGMLSLNSFIEKNSVDAIICFGNTLAHLNSLDEIAVFLQQAKAVLKPSGKLLLQIINYDRIIEQDIRQLPVIDNDEITFERDYVFRKSANKIDFNARLTVKSTQQIVETTVELLPLLKKQVETLLCSAGFDNYYFYGSFNQAPFSIDSYALIVEAW